MTSEGGDEEGVNEGERLSQGGGDRCERDEKEASVHLRGKAVEEAIRSSQRGGKEPGREDPSAALSKDRRCNKKATRCGVRL